MTKTVHRLKISLRTVKPQVWRRIEVRSETTLAELAPVLEAAMGWLGGHLHAFEIEGTSYRTPDPEWPNDDLDEARYRVRDVLPEVRSRATWYYDLGDGWGHRVVVERIVAAERGVVYPICLAGRRACPPDDCGGPWGYANLLEVLADPSHHDHEELRESVPPDFDPSRFDLDEATLEMRLPRQTGWW